MKRLVFTAVVVASLAGCSTPGWDLPLSTTASPEITVLDTRRHPQIMVEQIDPVAILASYQTRVSISEYMASELAELIRPQSEVDIKIQTVAFKVSGLADRSPSTGSCKLVSILPNTTATHVSTAINNIPLGSATKQSLPDELIQPCLDRHIAEIAHTLTEIEAI